jgi:hypothetical protein
MALEALASSGNVLHIYDFRVKEGMACERGIEYAARISPARSRQGGQLAGGRMCHRQNAGACVLRSKPRMSITPPAPRAP